MTIDLGNTLTVLNELGERYGHFQGLTLAANGQCRAVWAQRTENLTLQELQHLTDAQPRTDWQTMLGQALVHKSRGELAEARALELEVTDLLLQHAYGKLNTK